MYKITNRAVAVLLTSVSASVLSFTSAESAQPVATGTDVQTISEIVVTPRKRAENLLKTPVAVSALSGDLVNKLDLKTLEDIAAYVPGMTADNTINGTGVSNRSFQEIIIRGATPANLGSQTTAIFVNGAPVASGDIEGIGDLQRVEVLKGPQAAYFGRSTFAGAVNYITREPGNKFEGDASAEIGSRGSYDYRAAIGGPIIPDILTFRVAGRTWVKGGSYPNPFEPGQALGDESTKSIALTVIATPIEHLKAKFYGAIWRDLDGAGPTALIFPSQSNCSFTVYGSVHPYFCGTIPNTLPGIPSANTIVTPGVRGFIEDTTALTHRILSPKDTVQQYGLERNAYHLSESVSYDVPSLGFTITSLTAANNDDFSSLVPFAGVDARSTAGLQPGDSYSDIPALVQQTSRDFSQEIRLTSDQNQRFRWLVGGNYLESRSHLYLGTYYSYLTYLGQNPDTETPLGPQKAQTAAAFYGLAYDITKKITINAEGRYQADTESSYDALQPQNKIFRQTYKSFLPRVIVEYKPDKDVLLYATYSKGSNPGAAPVGISGFSPARQAQAIAEGVTKPVNPEYLTNYELGVKAKFLDGRATISADIYYDPWDNKIVQSTAILTALPNPYPYPDAISYYTNAGKVTLRGIEVEGQLIPIDHVLLNMSGAINDSRINSYACGQCLLLTGSDNEIGNQLPNQSKYSASGGIQYSNKLALRQDGTWYARADVNYKSGLYESAANLAHTSPSVTVNARAGIAIGRFTADLVVTNLFDNRAYTGVLPQYNFASANESYAAYDTLVVGLPDLRAVSLKLGASF